MPEAPRAANEVERLAALMRLRLDAGCSDACLEALTRCAAAAAAAPIALISLVEEERQWFLCRIGVSDPETPRSASFCAHAIGQITPCVVPDALLDERFADNPAVTGPPHVRAYLGVPLITADGAFALGTLCVADHQPRDWSPAEVTQIADLAKVAMNLIETRALNRDIREELAALKLDQPAPASLYA